MGAWKKHWAVSTPDFASVTVMLQVTVCAAEETVTAVGLNEKDVSVGAAASGSEVTVSAKGKPWNCGYTVCELPTPSVRPTFAVQMPASAYRGKVTVHEYVPLVGVPVVGTLAVQLRVDMNDGDWKEQVAALAPERSSVNVMLQVTVCDEEVVLIEDGLKPKPVNAGGVVSQTAAAGGEPAVSASAKPSETMTTRAFMRDLPGGGCHAPLLRTSGRTIPFGLITRVSVQPEGPASRIFMRTRWDFPGN